MVALATANGYAKVRVADNSSANSVRPRLLKQGFVRIEIFSAHRRLRLPTRFRPVLEQRKQVVPPTAEAEGAWPRVIRNLRYCAHEQRKAQWSGFSTLPEVCLMIDQLAHERFVQSQLVLPIGEPVATSLYDNECDTLWNRVLRICDKYALNVQEHRPA